MPLFFLLDENLPARVFRAIQRHNESEALALDAVCVGQFSDLPLSSDDGTVLRWADREGRILITEDKSTMPSHLEEHLLAGRHSPGVFLVRQGTPIPALIEFLVLAAHASEPAEWENRIEYIP